MADEQITESMVSEPAPESVVEATPVSESVAEPVSTHEPIISESIPTPAESLPENGSNGIEGVEMRESATAQPVEPLDPEPVSEPTPAPETIPEPIPTQEPSPAPVEPASTPEPIPEPTPPFQPQATLQPQTSTPPIIQTSLARELLVKAREVIQFRKRKKLDKIMSLFLKQSTISNDDIQKLLYVSDATATRYLDQLEGEGKIKRENAGKYLSYSRM